MKVGGGTQEGMAVMTRASEGRSWVGDAFVSAPTLAPRRQPSGSPPSEAIVALH